MFKKYVETQKEMKTLLLAQLGVSDVTDAHHPSVRASVH